MGIREVAERAHVSIATVSQVLNGKGSFSPETRDRVVRAAAELGYRPNPTAAALGAGRATEGLHVIGLAVSYAIPISFPLTDSDYYSKLIAGATEQALTRDYALVVGPPTAQTNVWTGLPLDGAIVVDPVDGDEVPATLRSRRTPLVIIGSDPEGPDDIRLVNDAPGLVRDALDHLVAGGSRRPALFGYPIPDEWVNDLSTSFELQCKERDLEPRVLMMGWDQINRGDEWLEEIINGPDAPDAVLCAEDDLATTLEAAANRSGLRIPDDLQIIVLSDRSQFPGVAFTTIELGPYESGGMAVNTLIDLIEGKQPEPVTVVPTRLVPRDSTRH